MHATYAAEGRWYWIDGATLVATQSGLVRPPELWTGWIYVNEKKWHTEKTVTLIGENTDGGLVILEMRRKLNIKTLKDGPPAYVIEEIPS